LKQVSARTFLAPTAPNVRASGTFFKFFFNFMDGKCSLWQLTGAAAATAAA